MQLLNPSTFSGQHPDPRSKEMLRAVIDWFETRGLSRLKADWHARTWNHDFVDFMKSRQVLATLMTPEGYGENAAWNTLRNVEFAEIAAFYGITYWYTFQVSMLGLGPVFNGDNEAAKQRAAALMKDGEVFAFGLSEREHGADIYSSEMQLVPQADGGYLARGGKYYIGNGNEAALVSVFGKNAETGDYVFFVVDSKHEKYECVKNTVNAQNYVAELRLHDYPVAEEDILSTGQKAWDDMLNTINYCKFNLGFGSIGLCTHALYEAIDHAAGRVLYGQPVTGFPQVKRLFTDAYCRLVAMRMFSYRATDYLRSASPEDRRYLLFNPIVKMKVTMEGEKVVNELWDVIAAKGFEAEPFFEIAAVEIRALPKLEGTAHVNMALIVKFMKNYLFAPADYPDIPRRDDPADDTFLFHQGPTRGLGKIRFHDYRATYNRFDLPNIEVFKAQIEDFRTLLMEAGPDERQQRDIDYLLSLGELFTLVVYGHLILEKALMDDTDHDLINQMFDVFVRDFSVYATELHGKSGNSEAQRERIRRLIRAPAADSEQFERVWSERILPLAGQYRMSDQAEPVQAVPRERTVA
ncbi:MAG: acyl-CoA dehydrogenase [Gammaproteobacteria bacterium]|nr:acyl-CoA dehydrogenase [Gammaproteobacteria bacterium]